MLRDASRLVILLLILPSAAMAAGPDAATGENPIVESRRAGENGRPAVVGSSSPIVLRQAPGCDD